MVALLVACGTKPNRVESAEVDVAPQRFEYTTDGIFGWIFDLDTHELRTTGSDNIESLSYCGPTDEVICLKTSRFEFVVPKSMPASRAWKHGVHFYEVSDEEARRVLGSDMLGFTIVQSESQNWRVSGATAEYFFSYANGLLVIENWEHAWANDVFISKETCGYGAPDTCWEHRKQN